MSTMLYLWIRFGSASGGMARYWTNGVVARLLGWVFPFGHHGSWYSRLLVYWLVHPRHRIRLPLGRPLFGSGVRHDCNLARDGAWMRAAGGVGSAMRLRPRKRADQTA